MISKKNYKLVIINLSINYHLSKLINFYINLQKFTVAHIVALKAKKT